MLMKHHLGGIIFLSCMIAAGGISIIIRQWVPVRFLKEHHEVAFPIFLQIGVIYAMLLSLIFSLVWDGFKNTQNEFESEASTLITLVHLAQGLPNPTRQQIQQGVTDYADSIVKREWKTMQSNREDLTTWQLLNQVEHTYLQFQPHSVTENDIYVESLKRLSDARNYRRMRIFQVTRPHPEPLWWMLGAMGFIVVSVSYLFGMEYMWSQAILTSILAGMIAFIVVVIMVMGRPYSGELPMMQPKPFEDALRKISLIKNSQDEQNGLTHRAMLNS